MLNQAERFEPRRCLETKATQIGEVARLGTSRQGNYTGLYNALASRRMPQTRVLRITIGRLGPFRLRRADTAKKTGEPAMDELGKFGHAHPLLRGLMAGHESVVLD